MFFQAPNLLCCSDLVQGSKLPECFYWVTQGPTLLCSTEFAQGLNQLCSTEFAQGLNRLCSTEFAQGLNKLCATESAQGLNLTVFTKASGLLCFTMFVQVHTLPCSYMFVEAHENLQCSIYVHNPLYSTPVIQAHNLFHVCSNVFVQAPKLSNTPKSEVVFFRIQFDTLSQYLAQTLRLYQNLPSQIQQLYLGLSLICRNYPGAYSYSGIILQRTLNFVSVTGLSLCSNMSYFVPIRHRTVTPRNRVSIATTAFSEVDYAVPLKGFLGNSCDHSGPLPR